MNVTSHRLSLFLPLVFLAAVVVAPGASHAAESYDNCTGFVDSVPATISAPGVWCLRKHLSTSITAGAAIRINVNNATVDCNEFKLGGLAAGDLTLAGGISARDRHNVTVRNCNVRGFHTGISLNGGFGHLVEDNRLDNNLVIGIHASGENHLVRRNQVHDTGGRPGSTSSTGIIASGDVIDNTVAGVFSTVPRGIHLFGAGGVVRHNRVRGLDVTSSPYGHAKGISTDAAGTLIADNHVAAPAGTVGNGVEGRSATETACRNNVIAGLDTPVAHCMDSGGNASL